MRSTPRKVLILDDSLEIRNMLIRIMPRLGWNAATCESSAKALARLCAADFALAMVDIDLASPGEGISTATRMADLYPELSIVMMSGDRNYLPSCRNHGFQTFLEKPFTVDDLKSVLATRGPRSKRRCPNKG